MNTQSGFSLIELLICIAIIAILAAAAYPNYQHHLQRSYRHQAVMTLYQGAQQLEKYYLGHHSYQGGPTPAATAHYHFHLSQANQRHFKLNAQPTGSQSKDPCGPLTLSNNGQRAPKKKACWQ